MLESADYGSTPRVCFEVEKVIGISSDGTYQVQWAPAWVSKFHLVGCEHLIQEFLQEQSQSEKFPENTVSDSTITKCGVVQRPQQGASEASNTQNVSRPGYVKHSSPVELMHSTRTNGFKEEPADQTTHTEVTSHDSKDELDDESQQQYQLDSHSSDMHTSEVTDAIESSPQDECSMNDDVIEIKIEENDTSILQDDQLTFITVPASENSAPSNENIYTIDDDDTEDFSSSANSYPIASPRQREYHHPPGIHHHNLAPPGPVPNIADHHKCQYCNQTFGGPVSLQHHLHTHVTETPYPCSYCGLSFSSRHHLRAHIYTHTQDKPFVCDFCRKSFARKDHLIEHVRTHTGEKPYPCEACGKLFAQQSNRNKHTRQCRLKQINI